MQFEVQNSNNYFEYVFLYLVKIVFITLELKQIFQDYNNDTRR